MIPLRRLSDLLTESQFLEVQVRVLQETGAAHHGVQLRQRIMAVHKRLDELERRPRRRALELGENDRLAISHIRRQLTALAEREPRCQISDRRRRSESLARR